MGNNQPTNICWIQQGFKRLDKYHYLKVLAPGLNHSASLLLLIPRLQFMRQVQIRSELLPTILFAGFSLACPLSPAFGTVSLPGRVAVKPAAIFAEKLILRDMDASLLLSPHPPQIHLMMERSQTVQNGYKCV